VSALTPGAWHSAIDILARKIAMGGADNDERRRLRQNECASARTIAGIGDSEHLAVA
jgi:hypothetical protein